MDFPTALKGLAGNPQFIAFLPNGPMIVMTARNLVVDIRNGKPRQYAGKFSDYVSIDWRVMTGEQFNAMVQKAAAENRST